MNIDSASANFELFKANFEKLENEDFTESDTRSKILDDLFINVLGWSEDDIKREGHTEAGYFDYRITLPNFAFIVEAKRSFVEFVLPKNHKTVLLNTIYKENKDVVNQIRGYLTDVGLQYGIITNGRQFIIAKFINSEGTNWKHNKCLVFNGINDVDLRFVEFHNCLHKTCIIENIGFDFLKEDFIKGNAILTSLTNKDGELIRNSLSSKITPIIDELFGEIYKYDKLEDKEIIEHCFVDNKEIKKNKSDIEKLFADKPPMLAEVSGARNTHNITSSIKEEFLKDNAITKRYDPPKPIIIIGSKGAGKPLSLTTFLRFLSTGNF